MSAPTIVRPTSVGFYAVAKNHHGKVVVATGPHDAAEAHRLVDAAVRPEVHARGLAFIDFGVIRIVAKPGTTLPTYLTTDGRVTA